jgi:hypothetical protein
MTTAAAGPHGAPANRRTTHYWQSHLSRKRTFNVKAPSSSGIFKAQDNDNDLPHPLRIFPKPKDKIRTLWVSRDTRARLDDYERVYPWVMDDKVRPHQRPMTLVSAPTEGLMCFQEGHKGILSVKGPPKKRGGLDELIKDRQARVRRAWRELMRQNLLTAQPLQ